MPYKITDACTACGSCLDCCPSDAIFKGDVYSIGEDCVECGLCLDECEQSAIIEE